VASLGIAKHPRRIYTEGKDWLTPTAIEPLAEGREDAEAAADINGKVKLR